MGQLRFLTFVVDQGIAVELCRPAVEAGPFTGVGRVSGGAQAGFDAGDNLRRFKGFDDIIIRAQFEAGQRPVMDVIPIYEELVKREQAYIDAKYEVVLIQLSLAASLGPLADGDKI